MLQNLDITGKLSADFGEGHIELHNVKLDGVDIENIGAQSLFIKGNTSIGLLIVNDSNGNARIVVEDDANVYNTNVKSSAKLEVTKGSKHKSPFANVVISPSNENGDDEVTLEGTFDNIKIEKSSKVTINEGTKITNRIDIESAAELDVKNDAEIPRVNISNTKNTDKIVLNGNLKNVNVDSNAEIEIKSGKVSISASQTATNVKINVSKNAVVETGKGNIEASGEGDIVQKENFSSEADIIDISFENTNVNSYGDEKELWNTPAGIKIWELLDNLIISDFAEATVIDQNGIELGKEEYVTEVTKVKVTSEDEKNANYYKINFERIANNHYYMKGMHYDRSMSENVFNLDKNSEKGMYSATVKFKGAENQEFIDGYYLGITAHFIEENSHNQRKYRKDKLINRVFIPKTESRDYEINLKDIDLMGYKDLSIRTSGIVNNKMTSEHYIKTYDNPLDQTPPSTEGIVIGDFVDTNKEKGKIEGDISFTKPNNEDNIAYYNISIAKQYDTHGFINGVGILEPGDDIDGVYEISIDHPISVGLTDDIVIKIEPVTHDGIEVERDKQITKLIVDNPEDEKMKVEIPKLMADTREDYRLNISNVLEGSTIRLYRYDMEQSEFIPHIEGGREVVTTGSSRQSSFIKLPVGKYKVTQDAGLGETEMSDEAIVKPIRPSGILQNLELSVVNVVDGATVTVYDEGNNILTTVKKVEGETPVIDLSQFNEETYYITQTIDEIESSKFVVPLSGEYTIDDISSSIIKSLNRVNINARLETNDYGQKTVILSKKSDGSVGDVNIDIGAKIDLYANDNKVSKAMEDKFGTSYLSNVDALSFNISSDFETLATDYDEFDMNINYGEEHHRFTIKFEQEEISEMNLEQEYVTEDGIVFETDIEE